MPVLPSVIYVFKHIRDRLLPIIPMFSCIIMKDRPVIGDHITYPDRASTAQSRLSIVDDLLSGVRDRDIPDCRASL